MDAILDKLHLPSPLEAISLPLLDKNGLQLFMKRDDLIHPHLCGNKWRKLKYNLHEAIKQIKSPLITFGGAFSNHLVAVASAGFHLGIETHGIIRSYSKNQDNETINILKSYGMIIHTVPPPVYKEKEQHPLIAELIKAHPNHYLIPEGGTNEFCIKGVVEMMEEIEEFQSDISHIITGLGTGGTVAGIMKGISNTSVKVIGISPFKGPITHLPGLDLLTKEERNRLILLPSFPETRFAAKDQRIVDFIENFNQETGITLDPIYTAKVVMTTIHLIKEKYFNSGDKLLIIHTGGLQGHAGYLSRINR